MDKKQMDSELALLEIETLVSNYTKTEVDIFISILCVRFMTMRTFINFKASIQGAAGEHSFYFVFNNGTNSATDNLGIN